jgi:hypothetical protein
MVKIKSRALCADDEGEFKYEPRPEDVRDYLRKLTHQQALKELTRERLELIGWTVHTDSRAFLGASKTSPLNEILEIRVDRSHGHIGGSISNGYKPEPDRRPLVSRVLNMPEVYYHEPQVYVRKSRPASWTEIADKL